ncbi:hypothetical protein [Burkholderia lata]|uniref:Uncharacterized protein n=1 Tax=Burkholderia lata (strain ATCC 17760 / DSM 23089 / LMG 22485 / NCIMB 9086 / R18194 / 383) TaxID=482957 RepID=A0A6P2LS38_BURL3|nr:hypothetical protein [Burkholderia lata]VWB63842.1 hypothetical protein BLA15816_03008 [Burkholderia lata]VWB72030.1 hypothetical protein BLA15945_03432 [Burkholderia lata]
MATFIASALILLLVVVGSILFLQGNHDYTDCRNHNYNSKLNGGIKEFGGKKYTIDICGSGANNNRFFGDGMDSVQLTVSDSQGEILAKRYYKVFWDGQPGHQPLRIGTDSITYQDDEKQVDYTITMPPTIIERTRARLPFFG